MNNVTDDQEDRADKRKGFAWILVAAGTVVFFLVGLPFVAKMIPWSWEAPAYHITEKFSPPACVANPARQAALDKLVRRLVPILPTDADFPLKVEVLHNKAVNAFATFGGHVFIYDGLLKKAESADEVAGVLAHEIEHVKRRHIMQGLIVDLVAWQALAFIDPDAGSGLYGRLVGMKFGRTQEEEADRGGLERLRAAHIDPAGLQRFFERLSKEPAPPAFLSDHPASLERANLAASYRGGKYEPVLSAEEFHDLQKICENARPYFP